MFTEITPLRNVSKERPERWLVVKSTYCSYKGLISDSQHPHGGTQPSIIPVPGVLMPIS